MIFVDIPARKPNRVKNYDYSSNGMYFITICTKDKRHIFGKIGTSRTLPPTNAIIPRTMAGFKRLVNKEAGSDIFQRSYHDHIIRNEKDYEKNMGIY